MSLTAPDGAAAVVGMACRFPGADDPDAYFARLLDGTDPARPVPPERWPAAGGDCATAPGSRAALLDGVDLFDRHPFAVSANEARAMDPQQRLLLETTWAALEDAGMAPARLTGAEAGVFAGISSVDWWLLQARGGAPAAAGPYVATGGAPAAAAGRIAYCLDLRGPALSVDTACSSALAAVLLAMESLERGDCRLALAGAVGLLLAPDSTAAIAGMGVLSRSGRTRPFRAGADGFVRGEGVGVIVLKPLETALREGDRIHAVVLGGAMNQDGRTNGLGAPSRSAQVAVMEKALARSGVRASDVGFVEAHGSATPLGDAVEASALAQVFADRGEAGPLAVGSAKSVVGHLEAAAGMAGLQKAILAVRAGMVPADPGGAPPAQGLARGSQGLELPAAHRPWRGGSRIAGVSAFGFTGTNVHLLVADACGTGGQGRKGRARRSGAAAAGPVALLLSAASAAALARRAASLEAVLAEEPESLRCIARAASLLWTGLPLRAGIVAADASEARAGLAAIAADGTVRATRPRRVVMVAGAVEPAALEGLAAAFPQVRAALEREPSAEPAGPAGEERAGPPVREAGGPAGRAAALALGALGLEIRRVAGPSGAPPSRGDIALAVGSCDRAAVPADCPVVRVLPAGEPPARSALEAIAALHRLGAVVVAERLHPGDAAPRRLPPYPFDRQRYWFDDA